MALPLLNGVGHRVATTGTGTLTLGAAIDGYLTVAQAGGANAIVYPYVLIDIAGGYETGGGTYTASGTTFSRDTVSRSSGSGNTGKISLSGNSLFFIGARAEDIHLDSVLGATRGMIGLRGASVWAGLAIGAAGKSIVSDGTDAGYSFPAPQILDVGSFGGLTTTSTSYVMAGLGAGGAFTPAKSGKVLAMLAVLFLSGGAGSQLSISFNYGTGTPPTVGAAGSIGTAVAASAPLFAGGEYVWVTYTGLITLTPGTPYWFDFALEKVSGGAAAVNNSHLTVLEF